MKAVMQREHLALHAGEDHSGLAFDLDGFILRDDEVADFEVEGLLFARGPFCCIIADVLFESLPEHCSSTVASPNSGQPSTISLPSMSV